MRTVKADANDQHKNLKALSDGSAGLNTDADDIEGLIDELAIIED